MTKEMLWFLMGHLVCIGQWAAFIMVDYAFLGRGRRFRFPCLWAVLLAAVFLVASIRAPKTLTIRQNRTETELPYDSIYYLESDLRKINVYGDVAHQPLCSYYGKLNELPQALFENGFLRVGRSAVVNMKYIRQISSYMVTLRNGVKLGVSRNGYAEIRSTYLEWKGQFGDD